MRLTLFGVVAACVVAFAPPAHADVSPFIIGGRPASEPYSFAASLQGRGGGHFCGGVLIKPQWVLTASHCLQGKRPADVQVRVGSTNRTSGGTVVRAVRLVQHPDSRQDQGLVQLASAVSHPSIPVAVSSAPGTAIRLLGWGATSDPGGSAPVVLQELDTRVLPGSPSCGTGPGRLCTDNPDGWRGACYGDSGGPAVTRNGSTWAVVGTTIGQVGGRNCADVPQIYSDVPYHRTWIASVTG